MNALDPLFTLPLPTEVTVYAWHAGAALAALCVGLYVVGGFLVRGWARSLAARTEWLTGEDAVWVPAEDTQAGQGYYRRPIHAGRRGLRPHEGPAYLLLWSASPVWVSVLGIGLALWRVLELVMLLVRAVGVLCGRLWAGDAARQKLADPDAPAVGAGLRAGAVADVEPATLEGLGKVLRAGASYASYVGGVDMAAERDPDFEVDEPAGEQHYCDGCDHRLEQFANGAVRCATQGGGKGWPMGCQKHTRYAAQPEAKPAEEEKQDVPHSCPHCGAPPYWRPNGTWDGSFECDTVVWRDGRGTSRSAGCLEREKAQTENPPEDAPSPVPTCGECGHSGRPDDTTGAPRCAVASGPEADRAFVVHDQPACSEFTPKSTPPAPSPPDAHYTFSERAAGEHLARKRALRAERERKKWQEVVWGSPPYPPEATQAAIRAGAVTPSASAVPPEGAPPMCGTCGHLGSANDCKGYRHCGVRGGPRPLDHPGCKHHTALQDTEGATPQAPPEKCPACKSGARHGGPIVASPWICGSLFNAATGAASFRTKYCRDVEASHTARPPQDDAQKKCGECGSFELGVDWAAPRGVCTDRGADGHRPCAHGHANACGHFTPKETPDADA